MRASHNRSLDQNSERLWEKMESEAIRFTQELDVPATANRNPLKVYAVYATEIDPVQLEVLKAASPTKLPKILTVAWAVEAVAYLGGYLEHRRKTPVGIQVLWRAWTDGINRFFTWMALAIYIAEEKERSSLLCPLHKRQ